VLFVLFRFQYQPGHFNGFPLIIHGDHGKVTGGGMAFFMGAQIFGHHFNAHFHG